MSVVNCKCLNMDKSFRANKPNLENLVETFNELKIGVSDRFINLDSVPKRSYDNASKAYSGGYNEEQSIKEEELKTTYSAERESDLEYTRDLLQYLPSTNIKIAKESNFSVKSLSKLYPDIKSFLFGLKINEENICDVYKILLEMEDITCMSEYVSFVHKNVIVNETPLIREYYVSVKNCSKIEEVVTPLLDEIVLVPRASGAVFEIIPLKYPTDILHFVFQCDFVATVKKFKENRVYFRFNENEYFKFLKFRKQHKSTYDIIFRACRSAVRYQHYALDALKDDTDMRKYLFPEKNPLKELSFQPKFELKLFNTNIASNPEQLQAIHYLTKGPNVNMPYVINGPPGTGKTSLLVEAILQILVHHPESKILVTAGSNSACDTIASRICKYFESKYGFDRIHILRIYSKSYINKHGRRSIPHELFKYSNLRDKMIYYPSFEIMGRCRLIIATLCTVGKYVTADFEKMNFFTHIIIDEAGASSIPETLVGIMEVKTNSNCRLILSGDHRQLGPVIKSERAIQLGLRCSLIEHLLNLKCYAVDNNYNYDHTVQARLKRNYRSHPEIVRLYNNLYYNNELIAIAEEKDVNMAAKWRELPNPKFPIIFQATHGINEKKYLLSSSFNDMEIGVVMWFVRHLLNEGCGGHKVSPNDIGIITPYKLQSNQIKDRLKSNNWENVETGSVETFQGKEKQIIIVSFVRSFSHLGFVAHPKRINVLLSRPKSLLILVGNPLTLRHNPDFAYIMDECKKHGTFLRKSKHKKRKRQI